MILLVSGIVVLCVIPLSTIVYFQNKNLVLEKTYEVCRNIANNIAKIADDELLVGDTYEASTSALTKLRESEIKALRDTYIIDLDGKVKARLNLKTIPEAKIEENLPYYSKLDILTSRELVLNNISILEFAYPIFIKYKNKKIRVGTAVFEFDAEEIFLPIKDLRNSILLYSTLLFGFGIGIAFFISISFSYPLQVLNQGAQKFGSGDFEHRIQLYGKDEIGQLAHAFNRMGEQIYDFTQNLEKKVQERTEELNQSLTEVKNLKIAQDGDYYLTSLLLEPLSSNNNFSKNVITHFITEQKKKFSFRNWESQIGGDICITDTIQLNQREYTVFLNADAMGKSIQGAGGALALGVVFNAGLIRSRTFSQSKLFPEIWIKERFLDLQNVFLSFDGTMYISVCMGLIDTENGMMYYINAEHPWTVLYRDGKASFLEEQVSISKIGTPGQESRFYIRTFQMHDGDILITGSDGRDDVIIGYEGDMEIINEDGNLFLKRVEQSKGDLFKILEEIKESGKLYDDISLLSISYQDKRALDHPHLTIPAESNWQKIRQLVAENKPEEALSEIKKFPNRLPSDYFLILGKAYSKLNVWQDALEAYLEYEKREPSDQEILFEISKLLHQLGKLSLAADYGERLFLRDPKHILNLIHLADVYLQSGIEGRAKALLERVLSLVPNHERANSLLQKITTKTVSYLDKEFLLGEISRKSPTELKSETLLIAERLISLQHDSAALKYLERAEFLDPDDANIKFKIACTYFNLKERRKAEEYWNASIKMDISFVEKIKEYKKTKTKEPSKKRQKK
ncbi:SpoIIE-like protein phosphatase domain protein [Leptospira ryugenii]|uniref:histidine kinase n=2 Tax=Leptospira ryugenii TaxID=1917863 RepID=A0A2P2DYX5_9LEPT|nr:SpoIIE-like protein phosphatase domain protein [Leptospira ryugenii]